MDDKGPPTTPKRTRANLFRPRFSVGTLLLAMIVFSVLGAAIYYGARAVDAGFRFEGMVVIVILCAPPLLLLTMKFAHAALLWINRDRGDD